MELKMRLGGEKVFFSLQMVVEVAADVLMQVHTVGTHHVISVARVDEEVGMRACVDGGTDERKRVLRNADGIVSAVDDEQATLQVAGLG